MPGSGTVLGKKRPWDILIPQYGKQISVVQIQQSREACRRQQYSLIQTVSRWSKVRFRYRYPFSQTKFSARHTGIPALSPSPRLDASQPQGPHKPKWHFLSPFFVQLHPSAGIALPISLTMTRKRASPPDAVRIALAHAVGYSDYPGSLTAEPYLNYIENHHINRGTLQEYLRLFIRVVEHFSRNSRGNGRRTQLNCMKALLDKLVDSEDEELFVDTKAGSKMRKEDVEDTLMYIMGVWSTMLSSFVQLPNGVRKVLVAYNNMMGTNGESRAHYEESLAGLIQGSSLLPSARGSADPHATSPDDEIVRTAMKLITLLSTSKSALVDSHASLKSSSAAYILDNFGSKIPPSQISHQSLDHMDSLESLSIKATRLNAFTLQVLGAVDIMWTYNVSRHMLLSRHGGRHVLEVFALPCVFNATSLTSDAVGIPSELAQEIQESYCILFNAWPSYPLHAKIGRYFGIRRFCWCWSCSAYRYRRSIILKLRKGDTTISWRVRKAKDSSSRSEFDPQLLALMDCNGSDDWTYDLFPSLWPRITALEEHLQSAKPWSIWILFRDRRDTLQFWTFL